MQPRQFRRTGQLLLAAAVVSIPLVDAQAASATWTFSGSGSWNVASDWKGGVPTVGAFITKNDAVTRSVTLNTSASVSSIQLANTGGGINTLVQHSAVNCASTVEQIGVSSGKGGYDQNDGTNTVSGYIGVGFSGPGTYTMGGGTINLSGTDTGTIGLFVGYDGAGTFNQSAGTVSLSTDNFVDMFVGYDNPALGGTGTGSGTYSLSGGTLLSDAVYVGYGGTGVMSQSGGLNSTNNVLLGVASTAFGTYTLNGNGTIEALSIGIAQDGAATFVQSAGTVSAYVDIASDTGSIGRYTMTGGTLLASGESIADLGAATFSQSAGTQIIGSSDLPMLLEIASDAGSNGTFLLSGSAVLMVYGSEDLGEGGAATFNQSGGTHTFTDTLNVGGFDGSATYLFSGGTLSGGTLAVGTAGLFKYQSGSLSLGPIVLFGGGKMTLTAGNNKVIQATSLSIDSANGSQLDLADNKAIISYSGPTPITDIRAQLQSGYNHGVWNGDGIISSSAASDHTKALGYGESTTLGITTFGGVSLSGSNVLIKYTYFGDANLDGKVDIADLKLLASHWDQTNQLWTGGDFNYDGVVNVADLALFAKEWQAGVGNPLAPALGSVLTSLGLPANFSDLSVPEPGSLSILICLLSFGLPRRRRI